MPIVKHIQQGSFEVWIWKSPDDILHAHGMDLSLKEEEKLRSFHAEKRQKEWLGFKSLLKSIPFETEISYLSNGKPVLNSGYISISHAEKFVAIALSKCPIGIDLQPLNPKIKTISSRFCGKYELQDALQSGNELIYLTQLWAIKEAVFKIYGEHVVFAEEIIVAPFDPMATSPVGVALMRSGIEHQHQVCRFKVEESHIMIAI